MKVSSFIDQLANAVFDADKVVLKDEDWVGILTSQSGELFPEIAFVNTKTIETKDIMTTYQLDMSSIVDYPGLQRIKSVYLVDADGRKQRYSNWFFDQDTKMLDTLPDNMTGQGTWGITSAFSTQVFPGSSQFPTMQIVWLGELTSFSMNQEIGLEPHEMDIFKKICIKEAINRILLDHVKLDRFRTLLGRANEYALIAIKNSLQIEIDNRKRRANKTNPLKSF